MEKIFGFHKTLENSWVAEGLATSQEGLSSIELVILALSFHSPCAPPSIY
jgi:hypothetical protein